MSQEIVECWFVGGPWGNRLVPLGRRFVDSRTPLRVPDTKDEPITFIGESTWVPWAEKTKMVDYIRSHSLETGTPVYTCLGPGGWYFALKSVM